MPAVDKGCPKEVQFYVLTRPEEGKVLHPTLGRCQDKQNFLGKATCTNFSAFVLVCTISIHIYKNSENSKSLPSSTRDSDYQLYGHADNWEVSKEDTELLGYRSFLVQELGFVMKREKSAMNPRQVIQLLGDEMHSKTMTFSLQQEKVQKIKLKCQNLYPSHHVSSLELIKVLVHLIIQLVLDYSVSPRNQDILTLLSTATNLGTKGGVIQR